MYNLYSKLNIIQSYIRSLLPAQSLLLMRTLWIQGVQKWNSGNQIYALKQNKIFSDFIVNFHIYFMFANKKEILIPKVEPVKFVDKSNGVVKGYSVNTLSGMVKDYNEDRVSIIMNITKPNFMGRWPRCSYFAVFDGHGGDACSNFLKQNMHRFITENHFFPSQPIEALKLGFKRCEEEFLRLAQSQVPYQRSGSCALVTLIIDDICYIANVGDSRAILSCEKGSKVYSLSYDHKPECPSEKARIEKAHGQVYQSQIKSRSGAVIPGPFRIIPGKLSVSRSFGDIEAKLEKYGGNPNVLIAKPEITSFEIVPEMHDFIVLGSDGIYDKLSNEEIANCFWDRHRNRKASTLQFIGQASSKILEESMLKLSTDNITSLIILFDDRGTLDLPARRSSRYGYQAQISNRSQKSQGGYTNRNSQVYERVPGANKENMKKQYTNCLTTEIELSRKLLQKLYMRKKSTPALQEQVNRPPKGLQSRKASQKCLKKESTVKVLPAHRADDKPNKSTQSLVRNPRNFGIQKIR